MAPTPKETLFVVVSVNLVIITNWKNNKLLDTIKVTTLVVTTKCTEDCTQGCHCHQKQFGVSPVNLPKGNC